MQKMGMKHRLEIFADSARMKIPTNKTEIQKIQQSSRINKARKILETKTKNKISEVSAATILINSWVNPSLLSTKQTHISFFLS